MNARGEYGNRQGPNYAWSAVGAEAPPSKVPWWVWAGAAGVALFAVREFAIGVKRESEGSRFWKSYENVKKDWKRTHPGLPWHKEEIKSPEQFKLWQEARAAWEKRFPAKAEIARRGE